MWKVFPLFEQLTGWKCLGNAGSSRGTARRATARRAGWLPIGEWTLNLNWEQPLARTLRAGSLLASRYSLLIRRYYNPCSDGCDSSFPRFQTSNANILCRNVLHNALRIFRDKALGWSPFQFTSQGLWNIDYILWCY